MVNASPERNFPRRKFAYHLPKPQTNRFAQVNGKQPVCLSVLCQSVSWSVCLSVRLSSI